MPCTWAPGKGLVHVLGPYICGVSGYVQGFFMCDVQMVLTCGDILSLFWCPAVHAVVYVCVETPVLNTGTNMLTLSVELQKFYF
jgi:hypothetical protein